MEKEMIIICNDGQLFDWMENGTLEIVLREIFSNEHGNTETCFIFGNKIALDFPAKDQWRLSRQIGYFKPVFHEIALQQDIKRYNKQRITCLARFLSEYIREWLLED